MEQIETQATDLRYLMQATAPASAPSTSSGSRSHGGNHGGSHSSSPHPNHPHHPSIHSPYSRLPADEFRQQSAMSPHQFGSPAPTASGVQMLVPSHSVFDNGLTVGVSPQPALLYSPQASNNNGDSQYPRITSGANSTNAPNPPPPSSFHNNSGSGTDNNNTTNNFGSPASQAENGTPSGKRKQDDEEGSAKQQRSKRNRYISIACNECKRRKIKCNGGTPCLRCGNLHLACLYTPNCCSNSFKDSDEYKHMSDKMQRLEAQLELLAQSVNGLRQETQRITPFQDRILPMPSSNHSPSSSSSIPSLHRNELAPLRQPHTFRGGPTSTAFTVNVAKNTLHNMGYSAENLDEAGGPAVEESPRPSPVLRSLVQPPSLQSISRQGHNDPLWEFDRDEMIRLCRLHEDEVGIMYPVTKIESVIEHAQSLSTWMESTRRSNNNFVSQSKYDDCMTDINTLTLKIIMCCALAVDEHGHSERAIRLYESMQSIIDAKLMSEPSDLTNLPFLALVAGYRFLSNNEVLAWRVMGQVARHCLEQGLHRSEGISKIADEQERRNAINTFWTAYVLDRRWSFGTGLPYVLHDDKIDPNLPYPDDYPYLVAMITYSRLGAKIWTLVDFFEPTFIHDLKREDFERLDEEVLQWYDSCPESVKISNFDRELPLPSTPSYNLQRLQIWTRLRLNQIRIWLHTPVLHSASSINDNMDLAQKVVDLAKDTIRYLSRLNNSSNLYRRIQVFYHQFLTSAIAVLFLASTHQPVHFSGNCREEFYMAMDLVKDMSAKSWVSQRLWRTIRSLKAYAPRLGLDQKDNTSSSYSAAAGISGFNVQPGSSTPPNPDSLQTPHTPSAAGEGATLPSYSHYHGRPQQSSMPPLNNSNRSPATTSIGTGPLPPLPALSKQQQRQQRRKKQQAAADTRGSTSSPDQQQQTDNGLKIQEEMTRIYEGYTSISGTSKTPPASTADERNAAHSDSGGGSGLSSYGEAQLAGAGGVVTGEGVYEQLKNMF